MTMPPSNPSVSSLLREALEIIGHEPGGVSFIAQEEAMRILDQALTAYESERLDHIGAIRALHRDTLLRARQHEARCFDAVKRGDKEAEIRFSTRYAEAASIASDIKRLLPDPPEPEGNSDGK